MNVPTTINTMVSPSLLTKISRFSDGGVLAILTEIIQNGRRAGAERIDIAHIETDRGPVLRIPMRIATPTTTIPSRQRSRCWRALPRTVVRSARMPRSSSGSVRRCASMSPG